VIHWQSLLHSDRRAGGPWPPAAAARAGPDGGSPWGPDRREPGKGRHGPGPGGRANQARPHWTAACRAVTVLPPALSLSLGAWVRSKAEDRGGGSVRVSRLTGSQSTRSAAGGRAKAPAAGPALRRPGLVRHGMAFGIPAPGRAAGGPP
jgi:hypothetical protein